MNTDIFKKKIEYSFDKYAGNYDSRTLLQKEIMFVLLHLLYQEISITNKKKKKPPVRLRMWDRRVIKYPN